MNASLRLVRSCAAAIMLMAVVASFAGPSVVSTIRLLDGDPATSAASESHLPFDMAAAPDQATEAGGESAESDGSKRVLLRRTAPPESQRAPGNTLRAGLSIAHGPSCGPALLCVYRL